jgi:hypothetical protein
LTATVTRSRFKRFALAGLIAVSIGASACAAKTEAVGQPIAGKQIKKVDTSLLPPEIAGLKVTTEDITGQLAGVKRSFVDKAGLFALRRGDLLVSTLQVSRFNAAARVNTDDFQSGVLSRVGSTVPKLYILSGRRLFLTAGNKQTVAVWFAGRAMFVLSIRQDYLTPRSLVRQMLDLTEKNGQAV